MDVSNEGIFKEMEKEGIIVFINLGDILILSTTKKEVEKDLKIILEDLSLIGIMINVKNVFCNHLIYTKPKFHLKLVGY